MAITKNPELAADTDPELVAVTVAQQQAAARHPLAAADSNAGRVHRNSFDLCSCGQPADPASRIRLCAGCEQRLADTRPADPFAGLGL